MAESGPKGAGDALPASNTLRAASSARAAVALTVYFEDTDTDASSITPIAEEGAGETD